MKAKTIESIYKGSVGKPAIKRHESLTTPDTAGDQLYIHNIKIKHGMAKELLAMGLSGEAVERILRLDIAGGEGKKLGAKGKRWR